MASYRYERNITEEDVRPVKERTYTRKERWNNWWDYNLKWVVLAVIVVGFVGYCFIGQYFFTVHPDYNVAVVAPYYLPEDTVNALETQLAAFGEDLNGDGETVVTLNVYTLNYSEDTQSDTDAYLTMAGTTKLAADVQGAMSAIYILYDPAGFEENTGVIILAATNRPDAVSGRLPARRGLGRGLVEHGLPLDRLPGADRAGPGQLRPRRHPERLGRQPGVYEPVLHRVPRRVERGLGQEHRPGRASVGETDRRGRLDGCGGRLLKRLRLVRRWKKPRRPAARPAPSRPPRPSELDNPYAPCYGQPRSFAQLRRQT